MTLNMTAAGPQPTGPDILLENLITSVSATNPGYTANLPGTLVEDVASTSVGAQVQMDTARVDAVNNVSPVTANPYVLSLIGQERGIPQGLPTNTNVYVVFSGTPGFAITPGWLVGDGTYQYTVIDGGVVLSTGQTDPLYCVSTQAGTWAVAENTVTQVLTQPPAPYTLTVTNPTTGTPGTAAESVPSYRSRLLQAQQVTAQGVAAFLSTTLQAVSGVSSRLVRILQVGSGWEVLVGGGDPYAVGAAILASVLDLGSLVGSQIDSTRNGQATIIQAPNTFDVTWVNPPQQTVGVAVTWNTNLVNFTAASQVSNLAIPAIINYINSIVVGYPLSEFGIYGAFLSAVSGLLPIESLTAFEIVVTINGVETPPQAGTFIYLGDPESYFYASPSSVTVTQG